MKEKILKLLKSEHVDNNKLGVELAKVHAPEIIGKIRYVMGKIRSFEVNGSPTMSIPPLFSLLSCSKYPKPFYVGVYGQELWYVIKCLKYLNFRPTIKLIGLKIRKIEHPEYAIILRNCTIMNGSKITCERLDIEGCKIMGSLDIKTRRYLPKCYHYGKI